MFCADCPEGGIDVTEDIIAEFDVGETGRLRGGELAGGFEGLPDGFEVVEMVVVSEEAHLCVVAGCAGGD